MHSHSGVEKGIKATGTPVEVMGLLLGRPCTEESHALVVTDVFPLPVEGAETRVLADDQEVLNYMIELGESLELVKLASSLLNPPSSQQLCMLWV